MDYWTKRAERTNSIADSTVDSLKTRFTRLYTDLQDEIEKEVEAFIGRFAKEGNMSVADAKVLLNVSEIKTFRRELDRYERFVKELSKDSNGTITQDVLSTYLKKLNTLSTRVSISRLEALKVSLEQYAMKTGVAQDNLFLTTVPSATEDVYNYVNYDLDLEVGFSSGLNPIQLDTLFKQRWMDGSFSTRIWKDKENLVNNLERTLIQGIAMGHNPKVIAKDLERNLRTSYNVCERLARTEVLHYFNEATAEAYKQHKVEEYMFLASLDERTCPICGGLDGKVFKMNERQEGVNYPVIHPNCRCSTRAYYREYEESGAISKSTRVARNRGGKTYSVPSDMTYQEWKKLVKLG